MFGYIKACQPDMRVRELETYKAVYCSLCKELGRSFGLFGPLILSYDFTFLALVRVAARGEPVEFKPCRCKVNPLKKCKAFKNDAELKFTAHVAVMAAYFKLKDDLKDHSFLKKLIILPLYPIAALWYRKAKKNYPEAADIMGHYIAGQVEVEREKSKSIDAAAQPTAKAMAQIFKTGIEGPERQRVLERLGYCVGRWTYLADAIDDLERDKKSGGYNPFLMCDIPAGAGVYAYASSVLSLTVGEALLAYELLGGEMFREIITNILAQGLYSVQKKIIEKKIKDLEKEERDGRFL